MKDFWLLAREMGRYKLLLVLALSAALIDSASAFAGFGVIKGVVGSSFGEDARTFYEIAEGWVNDPRVVARVGDQSWILGWLPTGMFGGIALALLGVLPLALFGSTMRFAHAALSFTISLRTVMRIRKTAYFRMLHARIDLDQDIGTADRLARLISDTARMGRGFSTIMGKAVRDSLVGSTMLLWAFLIHWKLASVFLLMVPVMGVVMKQFGKRVNRASRHSMQQQANMIRAVQESMQSPYVVRTHNAEGYERRRFNTINRQLLKQEIKARTARALSSPAIELLAMIAVIGVMLIAGHYVYVAQTLEADDILWVLVALGIAGASVKPLANLNNDLQEAGAAATRVREVLEAPVEPNVRGAFADPERGIDLPRHTQSLAFEDVRYRYPGAHEDALRGVRLELPHGCAAAIVGTNGSGKTTLLNFVPRLTEPTSGRVLVDGVDLAGVSLRSLREQISVVSQQSVLFEGTIADNIAYGRRETPREKIVEAAKAASAHGFVTELPDGYDTKLGEGGSGLSGGQKQRLCIARAVLRDPAILIMDEATSQIDAESEAQISEAVRQLREGRTTLTIAHRLSTVVECDPIVVMNEGQIADLGTHQELLERSEIYQNLVNNQLTS